MERIVHPEHVIQDWPFPFPPGLGCVTTRQVMDDGEPICSVIHFGDGDWLITGKTFGNEDDGMVVCFACLYERHPSIAKHASLKPGFEASLEDGDDTWVITPVQENDE